MARIRKPAVAGYFYESERQPLLDRIKWSISHELGPGAELLGAEGSRALGAVAPHAGYMYSGPVAAWAYAALRGYGRPDTVIVMGPNHYGVGAPVAIMKSGVWETPLGSLEVDEEVAGMLASEYRALEDDFYAFSKEHSIEVHLPLIQYFFGDVKIVPIALWRQTPSTAKELGAALAKIIPRLDKKVYIIASSDLNHYEHHDITMKKDELAISEILKGDVDKFFDVVFKYDISACGIGPIGALMKAASTLGFKAKLLKHATSGDTSGYREETVGYASILFYT
ncbi:MAG: AmmeMemoRadiSam system protein B [Thermoproteus sp.]